MKSKVYLQSASVIKTQLGIQSGGPAHKYFTATCFKYMSKYVPGGTMSHLNKSVELDVNKITYQSPSSNYLYNGKLYVDPKYKKGAFYSPSYGYWSRPGITKISTNRALEYHTPGTGTFWDKRMWSSEKNNVIEQVQKYVNRGCK